MTLKPDPKVCKERQLLVDDYVDNRMSETEKANYLKMLTKCKELYSCTSCQDNIQMFTTLKDSCKKLIEIDTKISNNLLVDLKDQLTNHYFNQ